VGGIGRASGKLILFGEHAAVYGHTAVGVSLREKTTVRLWADAMGDWDLGAIAPEDRETVLRILTRLETLLPELSRARCRVAVGSEVPRGVGFGSSAALCAALARAALAHMGELFHAGAPGNPLREWGLAHDAERLFHGTPSGIDTGLSILDGLFAFQPRPPALPEYQPLFSAPLHLVVAAVPRVEACGALVAMLGERMSAGHRETRDAIQDLGRAAGAARKALAASAAGGAQDIARLADQAMERLRGLGLSSPWLDRLLKAGKRAGALGGKLSGAGGGGAFFLVARDGESAHLVAASLEEEAARAGISLAAPVRVREAGGWGGRLE
jgi:mevalonate kinase